MICIPRCNIASCTNIRALLKAVGYDCLCREIMADLCMSHILQLGATHINYALKCIALVAGRHILGPMASPDGRHSLNAIASHPACL